MEGFEFIIVAMDGGLEEEKRKGRGIIDKAMIRRGIKEEEEESYHE